jgi:hypothetical protein
MDTLRPHELRTANAYQVVKDYDPKDIVRHRRTIIETTQEEKDLLDSIISTSEISSSPDLSNFENTFPSYKKALWIYERAPRNAHFTIHSIKNIYYRGHAEMTYSISGQSEIKSLILKTTNYARLERMMAQAAHIVELPSYRVLSVDDNAGSWTFLETGERYPTEEGFTFPKQRVAAIMSSKYAVMEKVKGIGADSLKEKLFLLTQDQQRTFVHSYGQNMAAEFLFGCIDEKDEHFIVNPDTFQLTRIDREQSLGYFRENFDIDFLFFKHFKSNLPIDEQITLLVKGAKELTATARKRWQEISELVRRNTNFGVQGKEVRAIEPVLMDKLEKQLKKLEDWATSQR